MIQMEAFSKDEARKIYRQMTRPGIIFALLAAFMVASYTIWDKLAVTQLQPFLYFYGYTAVTSLFYAILLAARYAKTEIYQEWQENKKINCGSRLAQYLHLLACPGGPKRKQSHLRGRPAPA